MTTDARKQVIDTAVCLKPLALSEVRVDGLHLVARPGLRFVMQEYEGEQLMISEPRLGLQVYARDRHELQQSVEGAIARLWRESVCLEQSESNCYDWRTRAVLMALFKLY